MTASKVSRSRHMRIKKTPLRTNNVQPYLLPAILDRQGLEIVISTAIQQTTDSGIMRIKEALQTLKTVS